jgi:hypothetical protein
VSSVGVSQAGIQPSGLPPGVSSFVKAFPALAKAITPQDPRGTGSQLAQHGFRLTWSYVRRNPRYRPQAHRAGQPLNLNDLPTITQTVPMPPNGTVLLSILTKGGSTAFTTTTRNLLVEISPPGDADL